MNDDAREWAEALIGGAVFVGVWLFLMIIV